MVGDAARAVERQIEVVEVRAAEPRGGGADGGGRVGEEAHERRERHRRHERFEGDSLVVEGDCPGARVDGARGARELDAACGLLEAGGELANPEAGIREVGVCSRARDRAGRTAPAITSSSLGSGTNREHQAAEIARTPQSLLLYGIMNSSAIASPKWTRQNSSKLRGAGLSAAKWAFTNPATHA